MYRKLASFWLWLLLKCDQCRKWKTNVISVTRIWLTSLASSSYWEANLSKTHIQREEGAKDVNYSCALRLYNIIYGPWYKSWSNSIANTVLRLYWSDFRLWTRLSSIISNNGCTPVGEHRVCFMALSCM